MLLLIKFDGYQKNVFSRKGTLSGYRAPIWCVQLGKVLPTGVNSAYAKVRKESVQFSGFQGVHARKRAAREPRRLSRFDVAERTETDEVHPDGASRTVPFASGRDRGLEPDSGKKRRAKKEPGTFRPPG